jgi:hypothetical protein
MQTNPAVPESARLWWGLIDPELSLRCAALSPAQERRWDWSLRALWEALRTGTLWEGWYE